MKKIIKEFWILAILLSALPSWAYDFCVDGIYYGKNSDGKTVYVTNGSNSYSGSVVIPSTVTDSGITYPVTEIGRSAFDACSGLTSVTIPNSVTSIGNYAFYNCSGLKSVTIPNSVTSIGESTFFGCSGLTSVIIPNFVTSIGSSAFYNCIGLTSVTIGNSVTSIGSSAFYNCSGLRKVVYNAENCKTMGSNGSIFQGCSKLTSLTIGESVKTIPSSAFYNCLGLTSVTIPNSVTSIGGSAFSGCSKLTSVTIGNSVTSIGNRAFYNCSGLTKVEISDIAAWCNISFGDYSANPLCLAEHLYLYGKEVTNLVIPNSVTSISDRVFAYCSGLTSVTIPNSVTSIGESAFQYCRGLTWVTIGNSVTEIGVDAFYGTAWYDNQPDGLVYAGQVAYKYKGTMPDNTSITIKDGTLGIAEEAFKDCSGLTSVTIGNSVTSIGNYAFSGCSGLTSVTIGNSVTSIGNYAFSGCSKLTLVTIPNSVTKIGNYAFYDCYRLTWVTIGKSVSSIGDYAYFNCNLKKVTSLAALPPTIMENTFSQSVSIDSTLYVYENSEVYYREDEFWQNFCKIETLSEEPVQLSVLLPGRGKVAIAVPYNETVTLTVLPNDVAGFVLKSATFNGVEIIDELDENYQYTTPVLTEDAVLSVVYVNVDGGVDQSLANRIKVSASNGTVRVMGAAPESEVLVCDLSGKIVRKSTEKTFTLGEGIYVLNVEGLSFKFAM